MQTKSPRLLHRNPTAKLGGCCNCEYRSRRPRRELPAFAEAERQAQADEAGDRLLKEEVDAEDIAEVVGRWTGIPVSRLMEGEMEKAMKYWEVHVAPAEEGIQDEKK